MTFLPSTRARTVVVAPEWSIVGTWWEPWASLGGNGVVAIRRTMNFRIIAIDHLIRSNT